MKEDNEAEGEAAGREVEEERRGWQGGRRCEKSRTEDDTLTRLEEIVSLCRDSRRALQTVLAAGNKLPLEISESLLPRFRGGPV